MFITEYSYYKIINSTLKRLIWKCGSLIAWQLIIILIVFVIDFALSIIQKRYSLIVPTTIYASCITTYGGKSLYTTYVDHVERSEKHEE